MPALNCKGLKIPECIVLYITHFLDGATIRLLGTVNSYFRKLISKKYISCLSEDMLRLAVKHNNLFVLNKYFSDECWYETDLDRFEPGRIFVDYKYSWVPDSNFGSRLYQHHTLVDKWNESEMDLLTLAVSNASLDVVKYLMSIKYRVEDEYILADASAAFGNPECLKFLLSHGYKCDRRTLQIAIANNNISCVEILLTMCRHVTTREVGCAAKYGHYGLVLNLDKMIDERDKVAISKACEFGDIKILKFLHKKGYDIDTEAIEKAVTFRNYECLKYLCDIGAPMDVDCAELAGDYLPGLKLLHSVGCPWDNHAINYAIFHNNIKCLEYLVTNGCPWDKYTLRYAVKLGHFDCSDCLLKNGAKLKVSDMMYIFVNTHIHEANVSQIEQLIYLHEKKCPWDENVTNVAAIGGYDKCLNYLIEKGCPINNTVVLSAIENDNIDCVKCLYKNNLCNQRYLADYAHSKGSYKSRDFLVQKGFTCKYN